MPYVALLRRSPRFGVFLLSEAISLAGDWFGIVAVTALAVTEGAGVGAFAAGLTLALHDLPMAAVRPFAGVLADRFDRRDLLVVVHVAQGLLTLGMALGAASGRLGVVQALVLARSVVAGFDWPARSGAIRRLVPEADLLDANALGGLVWSSSFAIGMALGGFVTGATSPAVAIGVDCASFFAATALLLALPAMPTRPDGTLGEALRRVVSDLREAVAVARASPPLLEAVLAKAPFGIAGGAGVMLMTVVAHAHPFWGSGAATFGVLQALRGIGTGVFPPAAAALARRGVGLPWLWAGTAVFGFGGIAVFAGTRAPLALAASAFLWGGGIGSNWMIASTELQRRASDREIGRLSGLDIFLVEIGFGTSALLGGLLYELGGAPAAVGASLAAGVSCWLAVHGLAARSR